MTTYDTLQSGTATVSGSPSFDDGPWTVHGVAQASEITQGVSGERRFWPPDTLRDAAEKLEGTPVVSPEDHDDLTPGQPDPTTVIGEVTDAAYDEQREALVYEAELDNPEFAKLAARERIDVSPSVALRDGDPDPERNAVRVAEVLDYRDLAAVTEGAHASASINLGTAEALARQFDVAVDALQRDRARTPTYSDTEDTEWNTPTLDRYLESYDSLPDKTEADSVDDLTREQRSLIARKSLLGTAAGDTLSDVRFFPVVTPETDALNRRALGAVRSGRGAQADIPDDALASARREAGELLIDEFDSNIDIEANATHPRGDDGPDGSEGQSTSVSTGLLTMDDLTDKEQELVAAARQKDDPTVVEAEVRERLDELEAQITENEDVLDEAAEVDEPEVMDAEKAEAMRERIDTVEEMMAEALQERTGLKESTVKAMSFEAMAGEFESDDGTLEVDALAQSPETGSGPTDDDDDTPDDADLARIEEIKTKLDHAEAALPDSRVEALRDEAATIADADDYEAALEVL